MANAPENHLGVVNRAVVGALLDHGDAEWAGLAPGLRVRDQRVAADVRAQGLLVEGVPAHGADQPPGVAHRRNINRNAAADHQRAMVRGLVVVAVEQHQVAVGDERAERHLVGARRAVEHEIGLLSPENPRGFLLRLQRRTLMSQQVAKVEHRVVEVVTKHRLAKVLHEHAADRAATVENSAIVTGAGPELVALLGIIDESAEEWRLQRLGILLQATDEILGDEGRCLLRQEHVAVDEIEHLHRKILEPLAADQEDDRKIQAAATHQVDQRRGLAFKALLAPVDQHAADGGVGAHCDLGVLELARPDDLKAGTLDFGDDLIEADALEIVRVKGGRREQERKASEKVHGASQPGSV